MLILGLVLILGWVLMTYLVLVGNRNEKVYQYREALIRNIADANMARGYREEDLGLYALYRKISYSSMLWMVWKPLDSFYVGSGLEDYLPKKAKNGR